MTETITQLFPSPVTEAEASALQLDSYVMHIKTNTCAHCGSGAEWSELYEVWTHPTKTRSTALHVLKPTHTIQPDRAIAYFRLGPTPVPVCSECVEIFDNGAAASPVPAISRSAWGETLRRKYAPEPEARSATKRSPTLDML